MKPKAVFVSVGAHGHIWKKIIAKLSHTDRLLSLEAKKLDKLLSTSDFLIHRAPDSPWVFSVLNEVHKVGIGGESLIFIINLSRTHDDKTLQTIAAPLPTCLVHKGNERNFAEIARFFSRCEIQYYTTGSGAQSAVWNEFLKELGVPNDHDLHTAMHDFKSSISWLILSIKSDPSGRQARQLLQTQDGKGVLREATTSESNLRGLANKFLKEEDAEKLQEQSIEVLSGMKSFLGDESDVDSGDLVTKIEAWIRLYEELIRTEL